ncbi:CU044_2847 family protein [Streptomyces sp. NBC_01275]|uniref:CU044_2847 family protein n=1 Tax=Streptomyces sp. NBC_01275 TaxID=2903807 RepID=UPI002259DB4C|nr:CU044_2847 family protein [Streptomyces sp. NBC_01275]MCX4762324.1 CU044_2847 family protein [Streptomyces sp. NBC_01275]
MGRLVEFPTADGSTVLVEVSDQSIGTVTRGINGSTISERAQQTFEEAVHRLQPAMQAVVSHLQSATQSPDEVQVEFGLNLHAQAGAFIAAASTTANFTVTLTWNRNEPRSSE